MEFKEWLDIFRKRMRMMSVIVFGCLAFGVLWYVFQPKGLIADLTLNVTRIGSQETSDYKYDDFYRLQADERFADTVVRWLGSPRIVSDIYSAAHIDADSLGLRGLNKAFKAERLSSQMVRVMYRAQTEAEAKIISNALVKTVNGQAEALNRDQKEVSWFAIAGEDPIVRDGRTSLAVSLGIALTVGLIVAFWLALVSHYFSKESD